MEYIEFNDKYSNAKHRAQTTLSKENIRGFEIVVKAIKKKFPYVTGYKFWKRIGSEVEHESDNKLYSAIPIELLIDSEKLKEFYGFDETTSYHSFSNISLFMKTSDNPELEERMKMDGERIKTIFPKLYHNLPDEMKVFYQSQHEWQDDFGKYTSIAPYVLNFVLT